MMRVAAAAPIDDAGLIDGLLGAHAVLARLCAGIDELARDRCAEHDAPPSDPGLIAFLLGWYAVGSQLTAWLTAITEASPAAAGPPRRDELSLRELLR